MQIKNKSKQLIVKGEFFIWHYKKHKDIHTDMKYKNDTGLKHRRPCEQRKAHKLCGYYEKPKKMTFPTQW